MEEIGGHPKLKWSGHRGIVVLLQPSSVLPETLWLTEGDQPSQDKQVFKARQGREEVQD